MTYSFSGAPMSLRPAVKISPKLKMGFIPRGIQCATEVKGLSFYIYTATCQWLSNWRPFITDASFAALLLPELEIWWSFKEDGLAPEGPIVAWGKGGEERELPRGSMRQHTYRDSHMTRWSMLTNAGSWALLTKKACVHNHGSELVDFLCKPHHKIRFLNPRGFLCEMWI